MQTFCTECYDQILTHDLRYTMGWHHLDNSAIGPISLMRKKPPIVQENFAEKSQSSLRLVKSFKDLPWNHLRRPYSQSSYLCVDC